MMPSEMTKPLVLPPLRVEMPSDMPRKPRARQAKGRANFLWNSRLSSTSPGAARRRRTSSGKTSWVLRRFWRKVAMLLIVSVFWEKKVRAYLAGSFFLKVCMTPSTRTMKLSFCDCL